MSLIWFDGFEDYTTNFPMNKNYVLSGNNWSSPGTYLTYQDTGRFSDSKSFSFWDNILGSAMYYVVPAGLTSLAVGLSFKQSSLVDATTATTRMNGILFYSVSGTDANHLRVYVNASGQIVVQRGVSGNILGTSAAVISANTWAHIGIELVRHSSTGSVNVYIDGVSVLSLTGVNTASDAISRVGITCHSNTTVTMDDFYVCDSASWLGEARVSPLMPTADTAQVDWTPSTGSDNYACVDEQPPSTTDYVSSSTVGDKDLYDIGDLSYTPLNILGVKVAMFANKDEITTRTVRNVIKSGGTTANGATQPLSTTNKFLADIWTTDPNTGSAWTKSGVDSLQIGMEVVA